MLLESEDSIADTVDSRDVSAHSPLIGAKEVLGARVTDRGEVEIMDLLENGGIGHTSGSLGQSTPWARADTRCVRIRRTAGRIDGGGDGGGGGFGGGKKRKRQKRSSMRGSTLYISHWSNRRGA